MWALVAFFTQYVPKLFWKGSQFRRIKFFAWIHCNLQCADCGQNYHERIQIKIPFWSFWDFQTLLWVSELWSSNSLHLNWGLIWAFQTFCTSLSIGGHCPQDFRHFPFLSSFSSSAQICSTLLVVSDNGKLRIFCTLWHFLLWQQGQATWMDSIEKTEIQIKFANWDKWSGAGRNLYSTKGCRLNFTNWDGEINGFCIREPPASYTSIQVIWQMYIAAKLNNSCNNNKT